MAKSRLVDFLSPHDLGLIGFMVRGLGFRGLGLRAWVRNLIRDFDYGLIGSGDHSLHAHPSGSGLSTL